MTKKQKKMLIRIIIAAVMLAALHFIPVTGWLRLALYLVTYVVIGCDIMKKAGQGILNGRVFDENFLMAVATIGAFALAFYEKSGDYNEAIAVMLFYQIGELFQSYAVGKSRKNISALMDIRPDYANIEQDGQLVQVDPDEVAIGTVIVVQPGEKVPIDGVITEGRSTLNTSALTGESLPRDAQEGDEIISGCINMTGLLKIRTTKLSNCFRKGHRIRVTVTSSAKNFIFPNSNTREGFASARTVVAHNRVYHGGLHASRLTVRVEP